MIKHFLLQIAWIACLLTLPSWNMAHATFPQQEDETRDRPLSEMVETRSLETGKKVTLGGPGFGPPDTGWLREEAESKPSDKIEYYGDGKTPKSKTEFHEDGSVKKETSYDEKGRITQETEYWPPKEGEERGNIKTSTTDHYDAEGRYAGRTRHEYDEEGRTISSEEHQPDGSKKITNFNPESGNKRDEITTHPNGRTKQDTHWDREGRKISEKAYREDGSLESDSTYQPDGSGQTQKFDENGRIREQTQSTPQGSVTKRYREGGSLESEVQTKGMGASVKEYREDGSLKSEKEMEHGMDTRNREYHENGSLKRDTEYYPDGSMRQSVEYSNDGSVTSDTGKLPAGRHFDAETESGERKIVDYGE